MNLSELRSKLTKSIEHLKSELTQIRTGRASPSLLENISLEVYGSRMSLKELGSITLLDSQTLTVTPWDKSILKDVAKAILESDLKINPVVDGNNVKVPFPALTEERRKEFTKLASVKVEECKNALRSTRQDFMKDIDKDFSDKKIGEDDKFSQREEVEKVVREFVENAEKLGEVKKQELLKIG